MNENKKGIFFNEVRKLTKKKEKKSKIQEP